MLSGAAWGRWLAPELAAGDGSALTDVLAPGPRGRLVWQRPTGELQAVCERRGDALRIAVPGVAIFTAGNEPPVQTQRAKHVSSAAMLSAFHRFVLPMILQARGFELLHASAVRMRDKVALFCGESGTGKSTIASALAERGHEPWADDAALLSLQDGTVEVMSIPFEFRVADADRTSPRRGRAPGSSAVAPLSAIIVLSRVESGSVALRPLTPVEGFKRVFAHAMCFDLTDEDRKTTMLNRYFDIASGVPLYLFEFAPDLTRLDALLDELEELLATP